MSKLFSTIFIVVIFTHVINAQEVDRTATAKGKVLIEVGSSPFSSGLYRGNDTGISYISFDDVQIWSVGADVGYFISDDFALKGGLGYVDVDGTSSISYKAGIKYYAASVIPLSLDVTGATQEDIDGFGSTIETPDPLWLGIQAGYAIFFNDKVSIEPSLRYNVSLNSDFTDEDIFEFRFSFAIFL